MEGYLGTLEPLRDQLLSDIGRDELNEDTKKEYQEKWRFHEYLEGIKKGKDAWWYKEMYRKAEAGTLTEQEIKTIADKGDKR